MRELFIFLIVSFTSIYANANDDNAIYSIQLEETDGIDNRERIDHERGKRSRHYHLICEISKNHITVSGLAKEQVISYQLLDMTGACVFEAGMDDVFLDYLYSIGDGTYQIAIVTDRVDICFPQFLTT